MKRQRFDAVRLTWPAYDDGGKRENSSVWKDRIKVGLYFWRSQAPHTPPRFALVCGISWRVPIGVSMRKRLRKKYKPTRVHKRWQKLNDFQDTGLNNVY